MRLAIVTRSVVRGEGQGRVLYEIARGALRHGAQVALLADRVETDLIEAGATWVPVQPLRQRLDLLKVRQFTGLADRALDRSKERFDVVHGNGFVLTRRHEVNTSHFVHGAWGRSPVHTSRVRRDLYGLYHWTYTALNARWELQSYRQARVVVAVSARVRQELIQIGVPSERIRVIRNGVDPDEFRPGPSDRLSLGLPVGVPLALFAGDIRTPLKNLETVLPALAQCPGVHLAVVGATRGSPYPRLAQRLGLAERVHFLGYRRDVPDVMRAADLFVFPSRYDPFSLVLLEAMASGLPVITAPTVGAADLVTPECGIVIPDPNDAAALGKALLTLADCPACRAPMGQAARAVAERHTWDRMAGAYLQLYQEVGC